MFHVEQYKIRTDTIARIMSSTKKHKYIFHKSVYVFVQQLLFAQCKTQACEEWLITPNNGPASEYCPKHYYSSFLRRRDPASFRQIQVIRKRNKRNQDKKHRRKIDPCFRIRENLRSRIKELLKDKPWDRSSRIGLDGYQLRAYLESKFQPGMTWQNYGIYWHVDHIKPLSKFNLRDPIELARANHYTNLQPLTAKDNMKKSDSYALQT